MPTRQQEILHLVYQHNSTGIQRISDLVEIREIGSPATVHAAITDLVKNQFLKVTLGTSDSRAKHISLAPKGQAIMTKLEKLFKNCQ